VIRSRSVERSSRSSTLAIAGFVIAVMATALVASIPGSPLHPVLPQGVEPGGPLRWLAGVLGLDELHGNSLVTLSVAAVVASAVAFLFVLREAWHGTVSLRTTLILAVGAHVIVATLPLLISRDVYSYIAYGNIAGIHHANPYLRTPIDFPGDAIVSLVGPKWLSTPAVYGPLFTWLASVVVRVVRSVSAQVDAFRITALMASLGTLALIATTARRIRPSRAVFAVAAFGMNPVVLFQAVGSGHNDLLVALAVAGAFALLLARREMLAVAAVTLGTLVKVTAGLPLLLLVVWCVARAPSGRRVRTLVTHAGLAVAIAAVFAAPFFNLHDPTLGIFELAGHEGWLAPSRFFQRLFDAISGDTLGVVARVMFALVLLTVVLVLVRAVWRSAVRTQEDRVAVSELGAAWGWSLVLLMLLGPILLPWYIVWALPLVWLLPRVPRLVLLGTSIALGISQWTAEPARFPGAYDANVLIGHYVITPVVIALLGWLLVDGWRRWRGGLPLQDEQGVPEAAGQQRDHGRAGASRER
jgi:alpha-1,6-mannosyltransferase